MTKKQITTFFYSLAFAGVAVYLAYVKGWIFADFESISPQSAYELLQNDPKVTLLDVRTAEEFSKEHIAGATLIPVHELSQNISKLTSVKNKKIILYCHSGTRSVAASRILVENGFTPLNVTGGIIAWKAQGLSVTPY
ncbi:MAG: rhodanese-like domain-containing protein [Sulfuricurvum sp.]|nr:rhodanese-like domain-containing protein [Sulfuricurvum sp.]